MTDTKKPWNIAHRGFSGEYPENTLSAFWGAINSKADIIEIDLQLTADNQVVVFHDRTIDRIFNLKSGKSIRDFDLKKLKGLDVGLWFDPSFEGLKIPTLKEVLEELPKNIPLILEIKGKEDALFEGILNILDDYERKLGLGYISVRDELALTNVRNWNNNYKIGLMQKKRSPAELFKVVDDYIVEIIQIRWKNWQESDWKELEKRKLVVTAFHADDEDDYRILCSRNIDGILTNFPSKLRKFLDNKIVDL